MLLAPSPFPSVPSVVVPFSLLRFPPPALPYPCNHEYGSAASLAQNGLRGCRPIRVRRLQRHCAHALHQVPQRPCASVRRRAALSLPGPLIGAAQRRLLQDLHQRPIPFPLRRTPPAQRQALTAKRQAVSGKRQAPRAPLLAPRAPRPLAFQHFSISAFQHPPSPLSPLPPRPAVLGLSNLKS